MNMRHTIWARRFFASLVFAMFLVLTPRAWVDAEQGSSNEEVPVQTLEQPSDCLWCPKPASQPVNCDEEDAPTRDDMWLNPDVPLEAPGSSPCIDTADRPTPRA